MEPSIWSGWTMCFMWTAGIRAGKQHHQPFQAGREREGCGSRTGEGGTRIGEFDPDFRGLHEGDHGDLSDMSRWDKTDRIQLE